LGVQKRQIDHLHAWISENANVPKTKKSQFFDSNQKITQNKRKLKKALVGLCELFKTDYNTIFKRLAPSTLKFSCDSYRS
jgi:hypothetical protein